VFQIVDDIKDLVLTEAELGKPAGHDLIEGVYTLPVLRALALPEGDELRALLGRPVDRPEADTARHLVLSSGGIESALATARDWADRAARALGGLADTTAGAALAGLAHRLIDQLPVPSVLGE